MGFGGYVSGPLLAVSGLTRVPSLILESNTAPGLTNRWLAHLVDASALAWEDTKKYFGKAGFVSGIPVRKAITEVTPRAATGHLNLLVLGGSLGSSILNRAMADALEHLRPLRDQLAITHQTGTTEETVIRAAYRRERFSARVETYLETIESEYQWCDLVISPAGATTCSELAASGRPSILIPMPLVDAHQKGNAEIMERRGASRVILPDELCGRSLASAVLDLMKTPQRMQKLVDGARSLARPEAARLIADRLMELAGRRPEAMGVPAG
jgi:UDP-N-acetylglucosamine--N-acetylmuramyl-(pentapeptide) pyrophosphoryl-undecaprenol N-acetylglucosamine transferase